jgi:uncharacterized protein
MSRTANAEERFSQAMRAAGHRKLGDQPKPTATVEPFLRKGDFHLGDVGATPLGISLKKLIDGRLLIQAASGAGKSWTLRRIMEQTAGLVQQILIDPEGEFRSLAKEYELLVVDATKLDPAAMAVAAGRAREHQISLLVDLSELDREEQMKMFASFVSALVDSPKAHWHPCIVAVDEAHLFAPFGGQAAEATSVRKAAISALVDLMSRGRKRGLCGCIATQRLARLSKSVASEVHNFLIGINTLDLDIRRAAETIGWDASRAFDKLPMMTPGEFVAVGPAFSQASVIAKVGPVVTEHTGAAPELHRPEQMEPDAAAALLDLESLQEASAEDRRMIDVNRLPVGIKAARAIIRDPSFPVAGAVWGAIRPMYPDGARIIDLAEHLGVSLSDIAGAVALLDTYGAVDFLGEGEERAVRPARWMVE